MPQTSSRAGGWNEPGLVKVGTEGPVPVGGGKGRACAKVNQLACEE